MEKAIEMSKSQRLVFDAQSLGFADERLVGKSELLVSKYKLLVFEYEPFVFNYERLILLNFRQISELELLPRSQAEYSLGEMELRIEGLKRCLAGG
jgi:hypothetical protein